MVSGRATSRGVGENDTKRMNARGEECWEGEIDRNKPRFKVFTVLARDQFGPGAPYLINQSNTFSLSHSFHMFCRSDSITVTGCAGWDIEPPNRGKLIRNRPPGSKWHPTVKMRVMGDVVNKKNCVLLVADQESCLRLFGKKRGLSFCLNLSN